MQYIIKNGYGEFLSIHGNKSTAKKEAKRLINDFKSMGEGKAAGSPPFMVYECVLCHVETIE